MKRSKTIIGTIGCVFAIIITSSCSLEKLTESLDCDSAGLLSKADVEKIFYQEALNAYMGDQSTANCQELRTSGSDYIQAVNSYLNCVSTGDEAVKRERKDAEKVLADLQC